MARRWSALLVERTASRRDAFSSTQANCVRRASVARFPVITSTFADHMRHSGCRFIGSAFTKGIASDRTRPTDVHSPRSTPVINRYSRPSTLR